MVTTTYEVIVTFLGVDQTRKVPREFDSIDEVKTHVRLLIRGGFTPDRITVYKVTRELIDRKELTT